MSCYSRADLVHSGLQQAAFLLYAVNPLRKVSSTHDNHSMSLSAIFFFTQGFRRLSHVPAFFGRRPRHVSHARQALDRVNEEAMKRSACGIAFLGDFWHARGSLKVAFQKYRRTKKSYQRQMACQVRCRQSPVARDVLDGVDLYIPFACHGVVLKSGVAFGFIWFGG